MTRSTNFISISIGRLPVFYVLKISCCEHGKVLKINVSEPKTRLFVGNIPKSKGKDEIEEELKKVTGKPISPTRTVGQILIAVPVLLSFLIKYKVKSVHQKTIRKKSIIYCD